MKHENLLLKSALALAIVDLILIAAILLQVNNLVKDILEVQNKQIEIGVMKEKLKKAEEARKQELETLKKKLEETKEPGVRVVEKIILQGVSDSEIKNWNHYEARTLGFAFDYPKSFGEFSITISPGERGEKFFGTFTNAYADMWMGGITSDFEAGREGNITDAQGYIEDEQGNFYFNFRGARGNQIFPIKIVSTNATKFILIEDKPSSGTSFYLGRRTNHIAALVNSKNKEFPGFAILIDKEKINQSLFEQILSTFKFID